MIAWPLLLAGLAAADEPPASPCLQAYKPAYATTWEISSSEWMKGCAAGRPPEQILESGERSFIERCGRDAERSVLARLIARDDAAAYCAEGVPGRARIPVQPGQENSRPGAGPGASGGKGPEQAMAAANARLVTVGSRVAAVMAEGGVAALYGEKAAGNPDSVGAAPAGSGPARNPAPAAQTVGPPQKGLRTADVPEAPYAPKDPLKAPMLKTLDARLETSGASPEAAAFGRAMYRQVLESLSPDILKSLVDNNVHVMIIPKDKKLTDMGPFASLKGKKTFDGRKWEDVKGVSGVSDGHGNLYTAIPEENLIGATGIDSRGFPKRFTFLHEFGHAVMNSGLPEKAPPPDGFWDKLRRGVKGDPPSREEVVAIYKQSMTRKEKTGLGDYADANEDEFYAQAAAAYFGVGQGGETAATLKKVNPKMYDLLDRVYGTPDLYRPRAKK